MTADTVKTYVWQIRFMADYLSEIEEEDNSKDDKLQ